MGGTLNTLILVAVLAANEPAATPKKNIELINDLSNIERSQAALEQLVGRKDAAVNDLIGAAAEGKDLAARGWAIVGLTRIGGAAAHAAVKRLTDDGKQSPLIRAWAGAAQINMAADFEQLVGLATLPQQFPALQRPFSMRATALAQSGSIPVEQLIAVAARNYQLQQQLIDPIIASGAAPLANAMAHDKDMTVRQSAAAFLGTLAQRQGKAGNELVGGEVVKAYAFKPGAKDVPWTGGPLYVPNIGWDKTMGRQLVGALISWYVWSAHHDKTEARTQIANNLNSIGLSQVVGYQPNWQDTGTVSWLQVWRTVAGKEGVRKLLEEQNLDKDPKYTAVIQ
jgi:hypothetical protein